ncbi:MAG: GNAT family N-acetyltransferase [Chloroflexi bacterium]|nr:GNAT family N-acetyltransferase [Chloroflexota bacterium]
MTSLPDELKLRAITKSEVPDFVKAIDLGFGNSTSPSRIEQETRIIEPDRSFVVFDGDQIVGTIGAQTMPLSIPGGETADASGVAYVTVKPSHRRRGILTSMMANQLAQSRDRNEPLIALWASEAAIYGRFGYGVATAVQNVSIKRGETAFRKNFEPAPGHLRMMSASEALPHMKSVWNTAMLTWAGMFERRDHWWGFTTADPEHERHGASDKYRAVYQDKGGPEGYVVYRINSSEMSLNVEELVWNTEDAHRGLWRFLLDVDLVDTIIYWNAPADDPLQWHLNDSRRLRRSELDGLWLRLVDVKAALEQRHYAKDGELVIQVNDDFCDWNAGTYKLTVNSGVAEVVSAVADPEIILGVDALASAYLGGISFTTLERAFKVESRSGDALILADEMFKTERLPWSPEEI